LTQAAGAGHPIPWGEVLSTLAGADPDLLARRAGPSKAATDVMKVLGSLTTKMHTSQESSTPNPPPSAGSPQPSPPSDSSPGSRSPSPNPTPRPTRASNTSSSPTRRPAQPTTGPRPPHPDPSTAAVPG
jgi:hypothetical protein